MEGYASRCLAAPPEGAAACCRVLSIRVTMA